MNILNITNLFRAYFIENKKTLLICCLISFGLLAFAFTVNTMPEILPITPYIITLWFAGSFFQSSLKKNNSTHFFNLPVSNAEKFIHSVLTIIIIGAVIHLLSFAGAYTGYYLIHPLLNNNIEEYQWIVNNKIAVWDQLLMQKEAYWTYSVGGTALLFGSIYFKSKAIIKSVGSGLGILLGISFYFLALISITFRALFNAEPLYRSSININFSDTPFLQEYYFLIPIALIVFFLSLTYLRLKETEV
ncbi:MAG: hypothetical protein LBU83_05025 [Bacteroidales bacterium]|jgi:hypothetical protein|nr:hypothetical protein [Bacteroidales bacterium]